MARPLSEFPDVIAQMARAASGNEKAAVPKITRAVRAEVERQGSRHHIKGRGGQAVQLGAKSNVRGDVGNVSGAPAGFWRIVEEGSGKHIIAGRYKRQAGIGPRQRKSNTRRTVVRLFGEGESFGGFSPVKIGANWRQYAVHPGHGSQGRPWRNAMDNSRPIAGRILESTATEGFAKAWLS